MCFKKYVIPFCLLFILITAFSCKQKEKIADENDFTNYLSQLADTSILPGTDFNKFSTGSWLKNNPIPADEAMWGVFQIIPNEILVRLKDINSEAIQKKSEMGSSTQKISDFWLSGMDTVLIEKQGMDSLKMYFDRVSNTKNAVPFTVRGLRRLGNK